MRELTENEISQISGGLILISFLGYKVTTSDVYNAGKWLFNHL